MHRAAATQSAGATSNTSLDNTEVTSLKLLRFTAALRQLKDMKTEESHIDPLELLSASE